MLRRYPVIVLGALAAASLYFLFPHKSSHTKSSFKVGIVQVIDHPALDKTRDGIIDVIKKRYPDIQIDVESAQGNPGLARQIAQKYVGQNYNVIVPLGTTPAQAALQVSDGKGAIVFASVTDPKSAKLEGSNITGVSNYVSTAKRVDMFKKLLPHLKTIGVIYNPGDANSVMLVKEMEEGAQALGVTYKMAMANKASDITSACQHIASKVDVLFINNDNTALSAFSSVVQCGKAVGKPTFVSDTDVISQGALAALGPDQYDIGVQAGEMVVQVLSKSKGINQIPIQYPRKVELLINKAFAEEMQLTIPPDIAKSAVFYTEK